MKKIIIAFLIISCNISKAQTRNCLMVEYEEIVSYIPQIINNDKGVLYVTNEEVYYKIIFDNVQKENEIDDQSIIIPAKESEYFSEIYIDIKSKILSENIFERYILKKYFSVKEKIPHFEWNILNEEKIINNYTCKKAEVTFRGRGYVVWYTEEIPISYGPWKFNGLPGLIILAEDTSGIYKWKANKITYNKDSFNFSEVKKRMLKYMEITFQLLDNEIIEAQKDKIETLKARNSNRNQTISFSFSTSQWKEPINQWRTETNFN
jgi:GLPGLI family protein